jgi:glycosyltransferase involved in cell wall biosynthesis
MAGPGGMSEHDRLKVLHVAATTTGGVGLVILLLIRHIDRSRFALSAAFGRGYLLDSEFDTLDVPVYQIPTSRQPNVISILRGIVEIYRVLSRGRYDIVQSHTSVGGVIGRIAGWAARTPAVVWTVHGLGAHPGHPWWKRAILSSVEKVLDLFTDHYVAVSRDLLEQGVRAGIYRADKVTVIPNGLVLDNLRPVSDVAAKRRALGLPEDAAIAGTITRLEPQKANDRLLHAFARVARQCPDVQLVIAGDGPERPSLEALAARLSLTDRVHFLGWRTDVPDILSVLDVFCMTSRWEGCPMVLLEAMAMRKPVVATDIGGVREIVVSGETGLLVPLDDVEAMAAALTRLLTDPSEGDRMGAAGRRRVEDRFSADRMMSAYSRLYAELAGRCRERPRRSSR